MKKLIVLIITMCLLISCTQTQKNPVLEKGYAVITGKVINFQGGTKVIRFAAGGIVQDIEHSVIIDSIGNFRAEIEMYHPQNIHMFYRKGVMKLFLYPADSIHLEINDTVFSKEHFPLYEIYGSGKSVNFSENIRDYIHYSGESSFNPNASEKTVDEFLEILEQEISLQDSILQTFYKENDVSPEFEKWQQRDIRYGVANYLLNYHFANRNYKGNLFDKSLFPVDDDIAISTSLYGLHLRHYALSIGIWQDTVALSLLKKGDNVTAYNRCLDKVLNSEKQGLSRDIMSYKLLSSLFGNSYEDFTKVYENVDRYIENQVLKNALNEKVSEYEKNKNTDISFFDPITEVEKAISGDFWKELKEKYKGKVIYVDIWATWCGPCREEIPHAIELHEYFKGKEIAFVNLCLSSEKSIWEQMIKNNHIKGENYFFNEPQTYLFRNNLKFDGYPTYLIINKDGKLIDKNAPRPSSKDKIRVILTRLIDENAP
jgi:thiol-disulfide isomerase/thioredoxin